MLHLQVKIRSLLSNAMCYWVTAADVYKMIVNFARSKALSRSSVYSLNQQFESGGRINVIWKPGSGRPKSMTTNLNKRRLRALIGGQ